MRGPASTLLSAFFVLLFLSTLLSSCSSQASPPGEDGRSDGPSTAPFKVGVILDLASQVGKEGLSCMEMARADFYAAYPGYKTRLEFVLRDSKRDTVVAASAAVDLLKNERVQVIVGPQTSDAAEFVVDLGTKSLVPVVSFSATSPSISPEKTHYFVRAAVDDSAQARAISALVSAFGWTQIVPIYEDNLSSAGAIPSFVDAIKDVGARVPYRCVLPVNASDHIIDMELSRLNTMEGRVFLVHTSRALGVRLFAKANERQMMMKGYSWIISEGLTSLLVAMDDPVHDGSMQGVLGLRPYVDFRSKTMRQFIGRWKRELLDKEEGSLPDRPSVFGLWAYDTVWALARAAESVSATDRRYIQTPGTLTPLSNGLTSIGQSATGPSLLQALRNTNLNPGLSGPFRLLDGQLQGPAFEVVNFDRRRERSIGFWTPTCGLTRRLNLSCSGPYSASMVNLGPVIWPGESTAVPKGWVKPIIGRTLKVLIPGPVLPGFHSFMRAERDPETNETVVGGFVFEVFEEVVKALPYAILLEYITLQKNGTRAGNYDFLVQKVRSQEYDALVGDVTVTANRSNFVDFTLPYMTTGVSMVVPYWDDRSRTAWVFLDPLTTNLWVVSAAFFVFTGAVIWVLEHRVNDEFRGPPAHQGGTVAYFIFSTLVFAHKEKMVSNLSKMVIIVWVFVVLVLQSSYTASLTSMLTVKHLRPTYSDIRDLVHTSESIGFLRSSFTQRLLEGMGFDKSRLIPYSSPDEYHEALSKGTKGGGVAAVVDEIPYLKVFLKDYCSMYTMSGNPMKAGGFGFAFPKGSSLVPDLSRAILNLTDGDKMMEIEKRWFGDQDNCPNKDSDLTSDNLSMASFWGLFLITGIASGASLLVSLSSFLYHNLHLVRDFDSASEGERSRSVWVMVKKLIRQYDGKDLSSHTFRKPTQKYAGDDSTATPYTNRTTTTATVSPYTDRSRRRDASVTPSTVGSQSPLSVHFGTFGGSTPPPELASPRFHESSADLVTASEDTITREESFMTADPAPDEGAPVSEAETPIN